MTAAIARFFIVVFVIGLLFLQASIHFYLFSLLPLALLIPLIAVWGSDRPWIWLVPWIIYAEIFATTKPGIMTAVALTPVLIRYLFKNVETDLSFSFLGLTAGTVVVQLVVLTVLRGILTHIWSVPWLVFSEIVFSCTLLSFVVCTIWMQVKPLYD